jgi:hypothetical protein
MGLLSGELAAGRWASEIMTFFLSADVVKVRAEETANAAMSPCRAVGRLTNGHSIFRRGDRRNVLSTTGTSRLRVSVFFNFQRTAFFGTWYILENSPDEIHQRLLTTEVCGPDLDVGRMTARMAR